MKQLLLYIVLFLSAHLTAQNLYNVSMRKANDMVYDPVTDRIYAAMSSEDPDNPNSISIINPEDNTVSEAILLGSEPSVIAISDNGQYIYIGFLNSSIVKRLDIATLTVDLEFDLGFDPGVDLESDTDDLKFSAKDIKVAPGQPAVIAVTRKLINPFTTNQDGGIGVYDNGIMRSVDFDFDFDSTSRQIYFKSSLEIIGYSSTDIATYFISNSGIHLSNFFENVVNPHPSINPYFLYHNNKAYFSNGKVLDVTSSPFLSGQCNSTTTNTIAFDTINNLVCYGFTSNQITFYENGFWNVSLKRFDPETYELYDEYKVPAFGDVQKIITCGEGRIALHTTNNINTHENFLIIKDLPLSVKEQNLNIFAVYPNPAFDIINFALHNNLKIKEVVVYNSEGKAILPFFTNNTIDIHNLSQGLYLIKLTDENNNTYTKKIIKI